MYRFFTIFLLPYACWRHPTCTPPRLLLPATMAKLMAPALMFSAVLAQPQIYPVTNGMINKANAILQATVPSDGSIPMSAYNRLAYMCDTFGPRFSGTQGLEDALTWYEQTAQGDGINTFQVPTYVHRWVRGNESAWMTSPRRKQLHMVGLGGSVGTGTPGNFAPLTADVIVINGSTPAAALANMQSQCAAVQGKIVLFNVPFTRYGDTVGVRSAAGVWGVQCGAVAALIRTIGPFSMQSPHTGSTANSSIPAAAVSVEDATQMQRMQDRGQRITVQLYMEGTWYSDVPSHDVVLEIPGTDLPNEYVLISGHCDSWDVAEGAMDDGGGAIATLEAMRLIKQLGISTRRTIRGVCWTNEENGAAGGMQYAVNYAAQLAQHSIVMESDEGAFTPYALAFTGHPWAKAQLQILGSLLAPIGAGNVTDNGEGTDIGPMTDQGVPTGSMGVLDPRLSPYDNSPCMDGVLGGVGGNSEGAWVQPGGPGPNSVDLTNAMFSPGYFFYHHTAADTVDRMDPRQLNRASAFLAIWAVAVADLPELLPRDCSPLPSPCPAPPLPPGPAPAAPPGSAAVIGGAVGGGLAGLVLLGALLFFYRPSSLMGRSSSKLSGAAAYSSLGGSGATGATARATLLSG